MSKSSSQLNDAISSDRAEQLAIDLGHQKSRMVIMEVVEEHIGSSKFENRVKEIQSTHLESTETYKKISDKVQTQIDKTLADRNIKSRNFWVQNILSAVALMVAILTFVFTVILKK